MAHVRWGAWRALADRLLGGEAIEPPIVGVDRSDSGGVAPEDCPEGRGRNLPLGFTVRDVLPEESRDRLMEMMAVLDTMELARGSLPVWLRVKSHDPNRARAHRRQSPSHQIDLGTAETTEFEFVARASAVTRSVRMRVPSIACTFRPVKPLA